MALNSIEIDFKNMLLTFKTSGVTSASLMADGELCNEFAMISATFITEVVLRSAKNRAIIRSTQRFFETTMYLDSILMQILIKLDRILQCESAKLIPYVVLMANHEIVNLAREYRRMYPTIRIKADKHPAEQQDARQDERYPRLVFMDDTAWSSIPENKCSVEENLVSEESTLQNRSDLIYVLNHTGRCSRFEAVCFFATKVLKIKTSLLAENLHSQGLQAVSETIFQRISYTIDVNYDYFVSFTTDDLPMAADKYEMAAKISSASHRCLMKLIKHSKIKRAC